MKRFLSVLGGLVLCTQLSYGWYEGPVDADTLDGLDSTVFLTTTTAESTYLGITDKAADSELLDGIDSTGYVSTSTVQDVAGAKTFLDNFDIENGTLTVKSNGTNTDFYVNDTSIGFYNDLESKSGSANIIMGGADIYADSNSYIDFGSDNFVWYLGGKDYLNLNEDTNISTISNIEAQTTINGLVRISNDGSTIDFSIDDSSATFYDNVFFNGTTTLGNGLYAVNSDLFICVQQVRMQDNVELLLGTSEDWGIGYLSTDDEFRIVHGDNVGTDAAVAFSISVSTWVSIGDIGSGTQDYVDGQGDLYVGDELEVDGGFYPEQVSGLPTTGYGEGAIIYNATDQKSYTSTETVTSANSWVAHY